MPEIRVKLRDNSKIKELMRFLKHLDYVESTQIIKPSKSALKDVPAPPFYTPKSNYTVRDVKAIAKQFPVNKKWTYSKAIDIFPPDLKIKLEILNNKLLIMGVPSIAHQKISNRLSNRLTNFVEKKN